VSSVTGNGVPEMLGELGRLLFETYGLTSNPPSAALSYVCLHFACVAMRVLGGIVQVVSCVSGRAGLTLRAVRMQFWLSTQGLLFADGSTRRRTRRLALPHGRQASEPGSGQAGAQARQQLPRPSRLHVLLLAEAQVRLPAGTACTRYPRRSLAHALTLAGHARRQSVSGVKYELSIDLLAAGRAYLDFLTKVEQTLTTQLLADRHRVAQAIDRYAKVTTTVRTIRLVVPLSHHHHQFLRLKSVFPSEAVWALPDIEFVWKSHLIRPLDYVKEMKATFGSGHDHDHYEVVPADFGAATALGRTAALWSQLYDGEPYVPDWLTPDLLAPFLAGGGDAQSAEERNSEPLPSTEGIKAPSWEEVRAGMKVVNQELVMEDAHWLPNLRRFLNVDKVRPYYL
jgi:hypothetical protein